VVKLKRRARRRKRSVEFKGLGGGLEGGFRGLEGLGGFKAHGRV